MNYVDFIALNPMRFSGGEGGIRTPGGVAPTTVFETAPFNLSGTSPIESNFLIS